MTTLQVTYFQRKRRISSYSLEFVFENLRHLLNGHVQPCVRIAPFLSNGLFRRLAIMLDAKLHEGMINHVTGDINFACILLRSKRTVLTILDVGDAHSRHGIRGVLLRAIWYRLPSHRCAIVTTISEASKQDIVQITGCKPEKVVVIPIGVSEIFTNCPERDRNAAPRILQVGTSPNKNLKRVVAALRSIECTLVIIGELDADQRDYLRRSEIRYENHVSLTTEELFAEYCNASLVVFASLYEGFGMPIVEAQSVGRAVITSDTSSMPEVAGKGACFVDPTSVDSIRHAILKVLNDERYRGELVRQGLVNVARFDARQVAREYLAIYEKIAKNQ